MHGRVFVCFVFDVELVVFHNNVFKFGYLSEYSKLLLGSYVGIVMHVHVFLMLCVAFAVMFSPCDGIFLDFGSDGRFWTSSEPDLVSRAKKSKTNLNFIEIWVPKGPHFESLAALVALRDCPWRLRGSKRCAPRLKVAVQGRLEIGDFSMCFFMFFELSAPPRSLKCRLGALGAPSFAA